MYVIKHKIENLYWSNEWGWGDQDCCDLFVSKNYNLPLDGKWQTAEEP